MSLSVLDKLHNRKGVSAELVAFLYAESQKPTMLSPEYAEAYAHAALHADLQTVADVSASSLIHGEQSYSVDTPISVVMHESTAVVIVSGGLVSRHEMGATASYEGLIATMDTLMADDNVKNIVCRFKSGGGMASGMANASNHIRGLRGKGKGLYAIADGYAFSSAYGLMSAFDTLWVTHGGSVGSIGVYIRHVSTEKMAEKMGVAVTYVYAGEFKISGNPDNNLSASDMAQFKEVVDAEYVTFTELVAKNRQLSVETVVNTQARCYSDKKALDVGLVDQIGTYAELLTYIGENTMTQTEIDAMKAEARAEGVAEAETNAKLKQDLAKAEQVKRDEVVAESRATTITAMCAVAGLDADATKAYVDSTDSVATVTTSLKALATTDNSANINTSTTPETPATASATNAWAGVNWK